MGSQTPTSWLHHSSFIRSHIIQMLLSLILLYTCRCHFLWAALACSIINLTLAQLTRTVYSSLTAAERRVDLISNSARPSCWPACGPRDLITFLTIGPPDRHVILELEYLLFIFPQLNFYRHFNYFILDLCRQKNYIMNHGMYNV